MKILILDGEGKEQLRAQSALEYLTTYGWAIIIIAVVLSALYSLGVFNPASFISTTCVFPAEFGCVSAQLFSSTSNINITLQQATTSAITITAYGCNNSGTPTNMITSNTQVSIGGSFTFNVLCYNNGTTLVISPGQVFRGYVLVNYTTLSTSFPHTATGTVVAKAV